MKSLAEMVDVNVLYKGAQYNEPRKVPWPVEEQRAFADGQVSVMKNPQLHRQPSTYFNLAMLAEQQHGLNARHQFRAGADFELQDLTDVVMAVRYGRMPQGPRRRSAQR